MWHKQLRCCVIICKSMRKRMRSLSVRSISASSHESHCKNRRNKRTMYCHPWTTITSFDVVVWFRTRFDDGNLLTIFAASSERSVLSSVDIFDTVFAKRSLQLFAEAPEILDEWKNKLSKLIRYWKRSDNAWHAVKWSSRSFNSALLIDKVSLVSSTSFSLFDRFDTAAVSSSMEIDAALESFFEKWEIYWTREFHGENGSFYLLFEIHSLSVDGIEWFSSRWTYPASSNIGTWRCHCFFRRMTKETKSCS